MQPEELKQKKRDGALHLIMFSDNSRTWNLEVKKWHLWLGGSLSVIFIGFSCAAIFFVFKSFGFYNDTVAKTLEYKNAISQYQIKYEGLYEKAYDGQRLRNKQSKPVRKPLPVVEKKVNPAPADAPAIDASSAVVSLAAKDKPRSAEPPYLVSYEVVTMKDKREELLLKIKVKNSDRSEKRTGLISAVATFTKDDGSKVYSSWPNRVELNQSNGAIKDFDKSNRYVIRAFKYETINFAKPLTAKGKFEKVELFLSESDRKQRRFEINVK